MINPIGLLFSCLSLAGEMTPHKPKARLPPNQAGNTLPDVRGNKGLNMALPIEKQAKYWGIGAIILALMLWYLGNILLPFVLGAAIAYFLDPVADRLEAVIYAHIGHRHHIHRIAVNHPACRLIGDCGPVKPNPRPLKPDLSMQSVSDPLKVRSVQSCPRVWLNSLIWLRPLRKLGEFIGDRAAAFFQTSDRNCLGP